ncbi:putative ATP-dependent RNA helicase DHX33 [Trichinella nativa]|uniref:RNA helicase n=1 Tax=Trichinella nativa TaxID=6335 RepID=A0A0V1LEH2_9BILA|nr:putative ATP-dependent RNA helicase DHX33 [Trichinella sp. T6]KRZ57818.1 putative ATP-dependent RNA helicase DHX33 [Trichinella nativa]OUC47758.1 putative helicase protein [Trichinella nativa]
MSKKHRKKKKSESKKKKHSRPHVEKLKQARQKLPIYACKEKILRLLKDNQSLIIIGETGCGKSTQIPQIIYDEWLHDGMVIGITQPRRVAAVTLAKRVSEEMNVHLGQEVGYSVRFDEVASSQTQIFYLTDGMLIREAMFDPMLERYSFVILDEAHERTLHTDVLFGVVKQAQRKRKARKLHSLSVVIMSATMDADRVSKYFNNAPVAYCQGRQHSIQTFYCSGSFTDDYVLNCLISVFQLHRTKPPGDGDVLVFLTGQEEIERAVRKCKEASEHLSSGTYGPLIVLPFYAGLSTHAQMRVFKEKNDDEYDREKKKLKSKKSSKHSSSSKKRKDEKKQRRVVIATNIAETSVTIPNIRYVVDSGKVKLRCYDPSRGIDMLKVVDISKAQADQRAGRAGRVAAGECYRVYDEQKFDKLLDHTEPEIRRCSLTGTLLQLLMMGIRNPNTFDFIDPPTKESLEAARLVLSQLGAVVVHREKLSLTDLGRTMAEFPVEPKLARLILASAKLHCSEEMIQIVSVLSAGSVFVEETVENDEDAQTCRRSQKFFQPEGDLIRLLQVFRAWQAVRGISISQSDARREWCKEQGMHYRALYSAGKICSQLRRICHSLGVPLTSCGENWKILRRALCYGFFMQAAFLDEQFTVGKATTYRVLGSDLRAKIHPSSCLYQHKPACLLYAELVLTNDLYLRDVTVVEPQFLLDAAPDYFAAHHIELFHS